MYKFVNDVAIYYLYKLYCSTYHCTCISIHACFQEKEDTNNQQPMEYAVVDKNKKKKKKHNEQEKVHK